MTRILYTGGTFDLFHPGHAFLLKQCRLLADKVIVSLNTDEFITRYKSKPPTMNFEERKQSLLSCKYVDEVVKNAGNEDSKPAILQSGANIVAIGIDWAAKDYYAQMGFTQQWQDEKGIVLVYLPHQPGLSSTIIKERVKGK